MNARSLLILGCGFTGTAVARLALARGARVIGTTRDPDKAARLAGLGVEAHCAPELTRAAVEDLLAEGTRVLVGLPPDGRTDAAIAPALARSAAIVYLSTTGVFGRARGRVDETTPIDPSEPKARLRLEAEGVYAEQGAVILRPAGIYGPERGLHVRIARGDYRVPEDGTQVVSRIHVEDLAAVALAALERAPGLPRSAEARTFVVADDTPVPQMEAIRWLSARLGVPLPPSAPLAEVAPSLRHDRAVDNTRVKRVLGVTLGYPSYREGFEACLR